MPELVSLHLSIGKLSISSSISWGSDDDAQPALIARPDLINTPDLDDDLEDEDHLGFRA